MFNNPFDNARAKVERAHRRFSELVVAEQAYSKEQPLTIELEEQGNGDTIAYAAISKLPSTQDRTIVADAIVNLRSSLDIATVQACIVRGQDNQKLLEGTYFAFGGWESDWWHNVNARHGRMKGADQTIRDAVASFKPWRDDGNKLLYALSKLAANDKHMDLVPVAAGAGELVFESLKFHRDDGLGVGFRGKNPRWGDHQRVELFTILAPAKVEIAGPVVLKAKFGFGDDYALSGAPVIPTLNEMGVMCQQIIDTLEVAANSK